MARRAATRQTAKAPAAQPPSGRPALGLRGAALILLTGLLLRLQPLTKYALWGSDTGEYLYLTERLATTGAITFTYHGWGIAYPYFPGLYALAGSLHAVLGVSLLTAIKLTGPLVGALTPVAVALTAHRVTRNGLAALAAGLLTATAMPLAFVTSHTLPGTPGHLLTATGILIALLGGQAQQRPHASPLPHALLLAPVALALTVTHHLSLYFLVGAIAGGALLRELASRTPRGREAHWDAGVVAALVALASAWWLGVATPFRDDIVTDVLHTHPLVVVLGAYAALATLPLLVRWKRSHPRLKRLRLRPRVPGPRALTTQTAIALAALLAGALIVSRLSIPGTAIQVDARGVLYVTPLLLTASLATPAARFITHTRGGALVLGWLAAILASLAFATITQNHVLLPYRHADYLVIPLAILAGHTLSLAHHWLQPRNRPRPARRVAIPAALALLTIANGAAAYPPASVMGGFEEGITHAELAAVEWAAVHLPANATVATDHRLSSILFGVAHANATWDYAGEALHAATWQEARPHMERLHVPSGEKRITHVLVSPTMAKGVALYQWENAKPLTPDALHKLTQPPYREVYNERGVRLYAVDWAHPAAK